MRDFSISKFADISGLRRFWRVRRMFSMLLAAAILVACSNSGVDPDDEEEGGIIGTGLILQGTITDVRAFASNSLNVKASTGQRSEANIDSSGRYRASNVNGAAPYLLRADLGNEEFRYGIAFDSGIANINSYSDVILRNWFASNNGDIDAEFGLPETTTSLPTQTQFNANAQAVFSLIDLVLNAYELSGNQLLTADYDAVDNNFGIHQFLLGNTAFIKNDKISLIITDPVTNTQSSTRSNFDVYELALQNDTENPSVPLGIKALPSATNEIVVVWEPSTDNRGVVGYNLYRDGELIATTPFPVYTDTNLDSGNVYSYEVVAFDAQNNSSAPSQSSSSGTLVEPDTVAPPAPVRLSVTPDSGRIDLIWGQSSIGDVVGFDVYRGRAGETITYLTTVTSSVMTDITVMSGVEYCYQVAAIDASGNESPRSDVDCHVADGTVLEPNTIEGASAVPPLAGLSIPKLENLLCESEFTDYQITTNVVVTDGCFEVNQDINVLDGGSLTLESGVILKFGASREIRVLQGGAFTSIGTKQKPVMLTGQDPTAGFWDGVVFRESNSSNNRLINTVIEYAGAGQFPGAVVLNTGGSSPASVEIIGSVIRECTGPGILVRTNNVKIRRLDSSVISGCSVPIKVGASGLDGITAQNAFQGNNDDFVDLGEVVISIDTEIRDLGIPYFVQGLQVHEGNLTVLAGTEFLLGVDTHVFVKGALTTMGVFGNPVRFSGSGAMPGFWQGIDSRGSLNLTHTVVEHAGSDGVDRTVSSSIHVREGSISVEALTVTNSSSFALSFDKNATLLDLAGISVENNFGTISIPADLLADLGSDIKFANNENPAIAVRTQFSGNEDVLFSIESVPHKLDGSLGMWHAALTIEPGVTIETDIGSTISLLQGSSISAVGTPDRPILISNALRTPGSWQGIEIESNNSANRIEHVIIEYAGGSGNDVSGAINLVCGSESPLLSMSNTTIRASAEWGVSVEESCGTLMLGENVFFVENALGEILIK